MFWFDVEKVVGFVVGFAKKVQEGEEMSEIEEGCLLPSESELLLCGVDHMYLSGVDEATIHAISIVVYTFSGKMSK
eukprot:m.80351 g.80351  ORF g.80351 m.80351 type:complete len:76 (-) comp8620_c0_seq20:2320-2547(-)